MEREPTMTDNILSLFDFNHWADRRILVACRGLTAVQYVSEPVPGWSSVRSSIAHIAMVTDGWLRTLAEDPDQSAPTEGELATVELAEVLLDRAQRIFEKLAANFTPEWLATPRFLQRGGRSATLPPWVVLRHIVNHSTYHRGQVASKLKRFDIEPPATDMVFWAFEQVPQQR
jgi:uncharacterized damage-inducible protein DinB